jgi:hypothetical protein
MDKAEFEKKFLGLVYQTNVVITAPNVAYHLGIPIEETQEQLLALELSGTIQQASDPQGNSYYVMPNRPAPGTMPAGGQPGTQTGSLGGPPGVFNPANLPSAPMYDSPAAKGMNVNGMVLNVIFPGLGSVICGRMIGLAMMALVLLGIVLFFVGHGFFGRLIMGALPIAAAWVWSIIAGVQLLGQKEASPGTPG